MVPTSVTADRMPMNDSPTNNPNRAVAMGRPIATTDPNANSRITTATSRPITSPLPASGRLA